jgi:hypothetical protein
MQCRGNSTPKSPLIVKARKHECLFAFFSFGKFDVIGHFRQYFRVKRLHSDTGDQSRWNVERMAALLKTEKEFDCQTFEGEKFYRLAA